MENTGKNTCKTRDKLTKEDKGLQEEMIVRQDAGETKRGEADKKNKDGQQNKQTGSAVFLSPINIQR